MRHSKYNDVGSVPMCTGNTFAQQPHKAFGVEGFSPAGMPTYSAMMRQCETPCAQPLDAAPCLRTTSRHVLMYPLTMFFAAFCVAAVRSTDRMRALYAIFPRHGRLCAASFKSKVRSLCFKYAQKRSMGLRSGDRGGIFHRRTFSFRYSSPGKQRHVKTSRCHTTHATGQPPSLAMLAALLP